MCLLALQYRTFAAAPILLAANREEAFDRPSVAPAIQPTSPRVLCGTDERAHGTWLGVNEHGLVVAVTNRLKSRLPDAPRSRGLLCRDLLGCRTAAEAVERGLHELGQDQYAGANYLCADRERAAVIHAGDRLEVVELRPGLHILTNGDVDDATDRRQQFARYLFSIRFPRSVESFVTRAEEVCRQRAEAPGDDTIVLRGDDRGTVSSTVIALTARPEQAVFRYADGAPDQASYQDLSHLLRELTVPAE